VTTADTLRSFGAGESTLPELLAYVEHPAAGKEPAFGAGQTAPEEPHVAMWREYAAEAARAGVAAALSRRFAQFLFPVAPGTSGREDYRAATRRGEFPPGAVDGGLALQAPDRLRLEIHDSIGGAIPVIVAAERADFVALVQALTARNEPEVVPASMGACIVSGLNNWDRVARHRAAWSARQAAEPSEAAWQEEFRRLAAQKPRYQDRLLLLSSGPYSAVPAGDAGLGEAEWLERSLALRREHECTHLFTQRAFGAMRNHALDELLADFAGLVAAFGEYRPELARRFLGVEPGGGYRLGGRLQNYRGEPPLSEAAFAILVRLVDAAIERLAEVSRTLGPALRRSETMRDLVASGYRRSLTDLAASAPTAVLARAPDAHSVELSTAALSSAALDRLMEDLAAFAARARVPGGAQLDLRLVLDELLSNLHKYARRDGHPPAVTIAARVAREEVELEIADDGPAFDPLSAPPPAADLELEERPIGGLGIHLVRQLTDQATYERAGGWNRLRLRKRFQRDAGASA
jgi:anti-sigma regulatory factor (Ser/Thr protein kinase)